MLFYGKKIVIFRIKWWTCHSLNCFRTLYCPISLGLTWSDYKFFIFKCNFQNKMCLTKMRMKSFKLNLKKFTFIFKTKNIVKLIFNSKTTHSSYIQQWPFLSLSPSTPLPLALPPFHHHATIGITTSTTKHYQCTVIGTTSMIIVTIVAIVTTKQTYLKLILIGYKTFKISLFWN